MGSSYPTSPTATSAARSALGLSDSALRSSMASEFGYLMSRAVVPGEASFASYVQHVMQSSATIGTQFEAPTAMGRYALPTGGGFPSMAGPSMRVPLMSVPAGALLGLAGKALARLTPWMAAAMTAYDLYKWLNPDLKTGPLFGPPYQWRHPDWATNTQNCGPEVYGPMSLGVSACGAITGYCCWEHPNENSPPPPLGDRYGMQDEGNGFYRYWMVEWDSAVGAEPNVAHFYKKTSEYHGRQLGVPYEDIPWPIKLPFVDTGPAPQVPPAVDPMSAPVSGPQQSANPIPWKGLPYRQRNPWRVEQPEQGSQEPGKERRRSWWKQPVPSPGDPGGPPPPSAPIPKPPGPGVKERELSSNQVKLLTWAFRATELNDLIDALYDALPEHLQTAGRSLYGGNSKAAVVYERFTDINVAEALANIGTNQVEDAIIGAFQGKVKAANEAMSAILGFDVHLGRGIAL